MIQEVFFTFHDLVQNSLKHSCLILYDEVIKHNKNYFFILEILKKYFDKNKRDFEL